MSYNQDVYNAVVNSFRGTDVNSTIRDVARDAFDISWTVEYLKQDIGVTLQEYTDTAQEMRRPSVLFRPALSRDGNMWCALLGDNLQEGVAGFGETPAAAMTAFDLVFLNEKAGVK